MSNVGMMWTGISSPYASIEDFTALTLDVGKIMLTMQPLLDYLYFNYDANAIGYNFEVPVYIIQGESDWQTPTEPVQEYFEKIIAPEKELVIVKKLRAQSAFRLSRRVRYYCEGFLGLREKR